ncbi:MAG: protocatechuate 3,4-dioxygenase subunit alpha [Streptosporangiaceae bacterium]
MTKPVTPSQTLGPFFGFALPWPDGPYAVAEDTPAAFWIRGQVFDGAGAQVPDALVETWQADPDGRFDHPDDPRGAVGREGFRGFARCSTDAEGRYAVWTVRPGQVPAPDGRPQAPHIDVTVLARGLLHRVVTRMYFPDDGDAVVADPVLASVSDDTARGTLMLEPDGDGYRFDIHLQGEHETVFFDF